MSFKKIINDGNTFSSNQWNFRMNISEQDSSVASRVIFVYRGKHSYYLDEKCYLAWIEKPHEV